MKLFRPFLSAPAFLTILLTAGSATTLLSAQDIILHQRITSSGIMGQEGRDTTAKVYISERAMRSESEDDHDFIISLADRKLILINHETQIYQEMTFAQMEEMAARSAQDAAEDPEAAEAMAALQQMMGGGDGEVTFSDEGAGEPVAGFATRKYRIRMPPTMEMEIWSAPELQVPAAYYDAFQLQTPPNPLFDMSRMLEALRKVEGLAVRTVMTISMMGMKMTSTEEVTEVERTSIPYSVFAVPESYTEGEVLGH